MGSTGYPQFPHAVSSAAPSPFAHHNTPGSQAVGSGYGAGEHVQQQLSDSFGGPQQGHSESRESRDLRHGAQPYVGQSGSHNGASHPSYHTKTADVDFGTCIEPGAASLLTES